MSARGALRALVPLLAGACLLPVLPASATAREPSLPWRTCAYDGTWHQDAKPGYRVDNAGSAADTMCVTTTTGHNVILPAWASRSPWLADLDVWFYPSQTIAGHGAVELVMPVREHDWQTACTAYIDVSGLEWCAGKHMTGPAGQKWPLLVVRLVHSRYYTPLRLDEVVRRLRRMRWLPAGLWIGSIAFGMEIASPGTVRYPDIRVGKFYASTDPWSRLPVSVAHPNTISLHLAALGVPGRRMRLSMSARVQGYQRLRPPPDGSG